VHHALERVEPGEVICYAAPGSPWFGVWGEITTVAAIERGSAGLVTGCGVRDLEAIEAAAFPVFSASRTIQGTVKHDPGRHECPILIGSTVIRQGDWLVGDSDGCVVIPFGRLPDVVARVEAKILAEGRVMTEIRAGVSSRQALALP
jgi:4-hydroxy-4-methyl-2-oxoglutarate aldolase